MPRLRTAPPCRDPRRPVGGRSRACAPLDADETSAAAHIRGGDRSPPRATLAACAHPSVRSSSSRSPLVLSRGSPPLHRPPLHYPPRRPSPPRPLPRRAPRGQSPPRPPLHRPPRRRSPQGPPLHRPPRRPPQRPHLASARVRRPCSGARGPKSRSRTAHRGASPTAGRVTRASRPATAAIVASVSGDMSHPTWTASTRPPGSATRAPATHCAAVITAPGRVSASVTGSLAASSASTSPASAAGS